MYKKVAKYDQNKHKPETFLGSTNYKDCIEEYEESQTNQWLYEFYRIVPLKKIFVNITNKDILDRDRIMKVRQYKYINPILLSVAPKSFKYVIDDGRHRCYYLKHNDYTHVLCLIQISLHLHPKIVKILGGFKKPLRNFSLKCLLMIDK